MALTKKDLKQIKETVTEAVDPYFTAIKADFNRIDDNFEKNSEEHKEISQKLDSLERRVIALEDMSTEHGKELRKIRKILTQLQRQRKVDVGKVDLLEKRIVQLEARVT